MTDYYETLGVSRNSTQEEIKKAYKKKAKKLHPDLNKDDPKAEEKFKEVNEAYKVLSDQKSRAQYDQFGHDAFKQGARQGGFQGFGGFEGFDFSGFDFSDIFSEFFGGGGRHRQRRGHDLQTTVTITMKEAYTGIDKELELNKFDPCDACKGTGAEDGKMKTCETCHGRGRVVREQRTPFGMFQTQTTCHACQGEGQQAEKPCTKCRGEGRLRTSKSITVTIPPGVHDGQRIRVSGEGEAGPAGVPPGDLFLYVEVKPHELFSREGDDLYCEIPISFTQAVLGADVTIPTLDGEATLEIPSGSQSHTLFRVRGYGMPRMRGHGKGDLLVRVKVETPRKLSKEQRSALEAFSKASGEDVSPQRGFFKKLKDAF